MEKGTDGLIIFASWAPAQSYLRNQPAPPCRLFPHSLKPRRARHLSFNPRHVRPQPSAKTATCPLSSPATPVLKLIKGRKNPSPFVRSTSMAQKSLRLVSPTISHEGRLPRKYTGGGQGAQKEISPPLEWYDVPDAAKSLALVVQDLDAPAEPEGPGTPWTHWVVVNIPPGVKGLPEGFSGKKEEEEGMGREYEEIKEGINDYKVPGWCGPMPPAHGHRIQFRLYALDDVVHLGNKVTKEKLLDAMEGHVLGEAELVAIF